MSSTQQRRTKITRAVKRFELAAESIDDLMDLMGEYDIDTTMEQRFLSDFNERIGYWERCTWWKK